MAQRNLRLIGDDILRKQCREVTEVNDRIRMILGDMAETMYAEKGLGLAAPQVGVLKRLVVIDMGDGLIKLVNPVIEQQDGVQECEEGCLSVPERFGKTLRPKSVIVRALDENGKEVTVQGEGDMAKCLCHELDHLDGILFVDHMIEEE
ncbi:MAG: peptide deformylase [Christensenella sp.]|uniref:peptide deformylase n=1 Tax=Christensenella sp. TaxID=1935934 RepID=UPI002B206291|nr:peptide deformylase [Christensenella sp.]MEA5002212.1 peptide deformylase [Christensenella sp.]